MNIILLLMSVCSVHAPKNCEDRRVQVNGTSLERCMARAPIYIAQWAGDNPKWVVVKWHCAFPGTEEQPT